VSGSATPNGKQASVRVCECLNQQPYDSKRRERDREGQHTHTQKKTHTHRQRERHTHAHAHTHTHTHTQNVLFGGRPKDP